MDVIVVRTEQHDPGAHIANLETGDLHVARVDDGQRGTVEIARVDSESAAGSWTGLLVVSVGEVGAVDDDVGRIGLTDLPLQAHDGGRPLDRRQDRVQLDDPGNFGSPGRHDLDSVPARMGIVLQYRPAQRMGRPIIGCPVDEKRLGAGCQRRIHHHAQEQCRDSHASPPG